MTSVNSTFRRARVFGLVAAIAGGAGAWAGGAMESSTTGDGGGSAASATGLATVVRADLASEQSIPGTIGHDGSWTVVLPGGTDPSALAQAQQKLSADQLALGANETSVADSANASDEADAQAGSALNAARANVVAGKAQLDQDQAGLSSAQSKQTADCVVAATGPSPACVADQQAVAQAQAIVTADGQANLHDQGTLQQAAGALAATQQYGTQTAHEAQALVAAAAATLRADQASVASDKRTALASGTTFTTVPAGGQVVAQGQAMYALDGHPVPLLYGPVSAWRVFQDGMDDGLDVAELNQALGALGLEAGPSPGAHFGPTTTAAIRRLQASLAVGQTGMLRLGDVVFEPGPLRIANVSVHSGSPAQPGATVLEATSTTLVVTALLPLANIGSVEAGDAVTIDLPNGKTGVRGHVRDVGASVSSGTAPGGSPGGSTAESQGAAAGGQGGGGATSVPATVLLSDGSVAQGLDQAAVLVHITTQTARGVLAVPVEALLALAGGGEGVEVVSGGRHRIVAVQTGVFTGTQVEIQSPAIAPGLQVEVPAG